MPQSKDKITSLVDEFLFFLETQKKYSPLTIRNYSHYLNRFCNFCGKNKITKISEISEECIDKYKQYLFKLDISKKTLGFHLIALRSFLKWLSRNGKKVISVENVQVPKASPTRITFLTGSDVEMLLNSPDKKNIQGVRDKAILELFYATGLRVSELTSLDKDSFNKAKNEIVVKVRGKGERIIFISTRAILWLGKYLSLRKDTANALFVAHKAKPTRLTPRSVQRMIKKYTKKLGISSDVTPKTLRHSFATDLLIAGEEVGNIQKMLGHKNISTTQIYTQTVSKK
jgi:integrase/recombinase XerD